jgi:alkylation response protein AidB-like acyl-CoA dehydrogenase
MTDEESPELTEFRHGVRAWIVANKPEAPPFKLPQTFLEVESQQQFDYLVDWQKKVYDAGYLGFDTPEEYGGRGVHPDQQRIVQQELTRGRAPFLVNVIGLFWAGPTILSYGTEQQKKRMLGPLLRGDEIWCQGFSEPSAGSDLASLQTRAVRVGDGWEVTGHKVWTTLAHFAKWMILLARTNPDVNKYVGLSYFLFPMDAPGVTVQPLIKMTGEGGFNQVLFEHAPMPSDALLGEAGQGWQVAMTTLLFERGAVAGSGRERAAGFLVQIERLLAVARHARRGGRPVADDPVFRDRIVELWIEAHALALSASRASVEGLARERPFALPLMSKLATSEWAQRLAELACEMLGEDATLWLGDPNAPFSAEWPRAYMNSFGYTIGGGTSEIQRNILGERVLGLPKSK